jgi:hypothetical protein
MAVPGPPGRAITSLSPLQPRESPAGQRLRRRARGRAESLTAHRERPGIRAILLPNAMMTTFGGRRSCKPRIQASPVAARALAKRMALPAPT